MSDTWNCDCTGPQPGAKVCPCREREEHAAQIHGLNSQINVQAENYQAQALEISRLRKRVETQQGMIEWLQAWKAKAEEAQTPQAQAERYFTDGE